MSDANQQALSILVVEDDPSDFGLVRVNVRLAKLERDTDSVVWAKTLAEAVDQGRCHKPDVVILDLALPDSAGLATVQAMRAALPDTPIIVLTGQDDNALITAALEAGAQDYLVKGQFDHDTLGRAVRHALVRGKLEQQLLQDQRHLEEMVRARTVDLARALGASEAANHAKSAFLANMSHEIRTPMNGIMGLTSLLLMSATEPQQIDRLSRLDAAAHHLLGVLNNILDMAKINSNSVVLEAYEFDPAAVLEEVRGLVDSQAKAKSLFLELECDPALPARLVGDPLRLKQVLLNLTGNAVKFTGQGGVTLRAQVKECDRASVSVHFAVIDTGIGIEPGNLERIFHPFEQADNSSTRAYGGAGLGLAISQSIVTLMGGRIEVGSIPGQGSTLAFTIRLGVPAAAPAPDKPALSSPGKPRVLVADEDLLNQQIVCGLLRESGTDVALAGDGGTAVDLALGGHYDLIFLGQQMPVMNGLEASLCIRQIPHHSHTPIVAMTADAFAVTREKCLHSGMNDCISKPIAPGQLQATLRKWLNDVHVSTPVPGVPIHG